MPATTWLDLLLLVLVVSAAVIDLAIRKIPNLLLLGGWLGALGLYGNVAMPGAAIGTALGGALIGFALFLPLYALRGMAAGDVKLMATVGLFLGPPVPGTVPARKSVGSMPYGLAIALSTLWLLAQRHHA